jgi:hypothetical protein
MGDDHFPQSFRVAVTNHEKAKFVADRKKNSRSFSFSGLQRSKTSTPYRGNVFVLFNPIFFFSHFFDPFFFSPLSFLLSFFSSTLHLCRMGNSVSSQLSTVERETFSKLPTTNLLDDKFIEEISVKNQLVSSAEQASATTVVGALPFGCYFSFLLASSLFLFLVNRNLWSELLRFWTLSVSFRSTPA